VVLAVYRKTHGGGGGLCLKNTYNFITQRIIFYGLDVFTNNLFLVHILHVGKKKTLDILYKEVVRVSWFPL